MTSPAGSGPVPPPPHTRSDQPYFSRAGLAAGAVSMTSMLPSQIAFGAVFGMLAADKALTGIEAAAMSGLMFAGFAQVVVLQYWPEQLTLAALAGLMISAFTINLRFFLIGLTLRTWFGPLPAWQSYPTLLFSTDPGWLKSMRYYENGGRDVGYFLGGGLFAFVVWCLATVVGHEFSGWLTDPKRFGIDMIVPAFFSALLVPIWKGPRRAVPWVAAGIVALIVQRLGFAYWSIAGGAVAGAIVAGLMSDE